MFKWEFRLPKTRTPVLEVRIKGHVDLPTLRAEYLPRLRAEFEKHTALGLVVDCREMTGFDINVPKEHAYMLNEYLHTIHSVAVVTDSSVATFGVAAASMVIRKRSLRAFQTPEEAYTWCAVQHRDFPKTHAGASASTGKTFKRSS